jgi:hypothetical protein
VIAVSGRLGRADHDLDRDRLFTDACSFGRFIHESRKAGEDRKVKRYRTCDDRDQSAPGHRDRLRQRGSAVRGHG